MKSFILTVDETGRAYCLYSEVIDLSQLGSLEIERASTIEFNGQRQKWEVRNRKRVTLFTDWSRQNCLGWEQSHADAFRKEFKP